MSMDKDREAFETMARRFGATEDQLRQDEDGCYFDRETQSHWIVFGIAWAESRAALVIELPYADQEFEYRHGGTTYFDGPEYRDAVFKAVESHGIKVVSP